MAEIDSDAEEPMRRWPRGGTGAAVAFLALLASACAPAGSSGGGSSAIAKSLTAGVIGTAGPASSLWCASPGNCTVGGWYRPAGAGSRRPTQAFAISEVHGTWGVPQPIRGMTAPINWMPPWSPLAGISCTSAGNCLAAGTGEPAGYSLKAPPAWRARVAREVNGTWGPDESTSVTATAP
jgi:hypothetical protein